MANKLDRMPECWLRLGTMADKEYVIKAGGLFAGVILNANLVEGCPGASASLAVKLDREGIGYWIDPYTYPFAQAISYLKSQGKTRRGKIKRTFLHLAEEYGEPILGRIHAGKPVQSADFSSPELLKQFCQRVLKHQISRLQAEFEKDPVMQDFADTIAAPVRVVAPYFFMTGPGSAWCGVNIKLAKEFCSAAKSDGLQAFSYLCFPEEVLDYRRQVQKLVDKWKEIECDGYILWVSDLVETTVSRQRLLNYRFLCEKLGSGGKSVINAHGGYLSALLAYFGMTGFAHGIGYGEHRDVIPVLGGGAPPARYYCPPLHVMLQPAQVEAFLPTLGIDTAQSFHKNMCDCSICQGVLRGKVSNFSEYTATKRSESGKRRVPTPAAMKKCKYHFLLARRKELDKLVDTTLEDALDALRTAQEQYQEETAIASVRYLALWAKALSP